MSHLDESSRAEVIATARLVTQLHRSIVFPTMTRNLPTVLQFETFFKTLHLCYIYNVCTIFNSGSNSQMSKVKFKQTDHAAEELAVLGTRQTVSTDRIGGFPSRAAGMPH